jgi:glycosyltransferase involved in cell wall biosynthesis
MVGDEAKSAVMNSSKALLFPVLWHEPFGIAIIESLYFGCPVFGTPYGSLPELVPAAVGLLSASKSQLAAGLRNVENFNKEYCHQYAADNFNIGKMAAAYLALYEQVLNGQALNSEQPKLINNDQPKYLPWNN